MINNDYNTIILTGDNINKKIKINGVIKFMRHCSARCTRTFLKVEHDQILNDNNLYTAAKLYYISLIIKTDYNSNIIADGMLYTYQLSKTYFYNAHT